ncbi:MAG TPA: hypothetical protein VLE74_02365 [Candidatus Saccharimonadales bacterium]|nr:hypothetical protein [Candidatus Saccharimonadales bacterium]
MGTSHPNRQGPNAGNVIDLTDRSEGAQVLAVRKELGHAMLVDVAPQAAELPQPQQVGAEHEPAPQQLVSAGQK